jgi:hypothetical protein
MVQVNAAKAPERKCLCGQQMTHLSDLGRTAKYQAVRVYRCYDCNYVISEWIA